MSPQEMPVRRVAIIGGARIPFARSDGPYATASDQQMGDGPGTGLRATVLERAWERRAYRS
ncbi:hypothetical protein GCM10023086_18860 [Streptomyces venetus]|uniref:Acetyl-CoA C-acyltransferase n=1 Tax=Streptomyces venetus TaxID=1701086 RepID=A0ABP8FFE5_9ACTN